MHNDYFKDKWVAVTGASSGIGWSACVELAKSGAHVIAIARNRERLRKLQSELEVVRSSPHQKIQTLECDLREPQALEGLASNLLATCDLDMLIYSAGVSYPDFLHKIPANEIDSLFATNLLAPIRLTRFLLPHFQNRKRGHIGFVGSISGEINIVGYSVYGATKSGLFAFADSLRNELVPYGVKVSIILPPDTDTPMLEGEKAKRPEVVQKISEGGGLLTPAVVAGKLLQGMSKRKFRLYADSTSWALMLAFRLFPNLMRAYLDGKVKKLSGV